MDWNSLYIHSFIYLFILVANNFYETVYVLSKASQNNKHLPHFLFLLYYNVATVVCVGRIDSLVFGVKFSISSLSFFCFLLFLRDDVLYWFESIWFDLIRLIHFNSIIIRCMHWFSIFTIISLSFIRLIADVMIDSWFTIPVTDVVMIDFFSSIGRRFQSFAFFA